MNFYISKSDFKVGSSCAKKLWYKKNGYPTKDDESEYMEYLAKGGYIVAKMAQVIFGGGIDLSAIDNWQEAVSKTRELIEAHENIILYEATVFSKGKLVRIDILEKKGKLLQIIEVKAKSSDSAEENYIPTPYLDDVLYQVLAMEEAYPDFEVQGYLFLPDKNANNSIEGLAGWFQVVEDNQRELQELDELPARSGGKFYVPEVRFIYEGDPKEAMYLQELRDNSLFELRNIKQMDFMGDWESAKQVVENSFQRLYAAVCDGPFKGNSQITKECKKCEYVSDKDGKNGFKECWSAYKDRDLSALDLYYGGSIKHDGAFYINYLIEQRKLSLKDVDLEILTRGRAQAQLSNRTLRQLLQIQAAFTNQEQINIACLKEEIEGWEDALYFIDFETYTGAIPFHKNMRPYELIAFQWSSHRLDRKTGKLTHTCYLNEGEGFPNFRFAEALMKTVGDEGTPLMWSPHENTVLRKILAQMETQDYKNNALKEWLTTMTHDSKTKRKGRLVDMCKLCEANYLHPDNRGKASIKKILPSIWKNTANTFLHQHELFSKYYGTNEDGNIIDPYKMLKAVVPLFNEIESLEQEEVVAEGTAAMRAYYEMIFGKGRNSKSKREEIKQLLLQYCELDTMAMVIIYAYWQKVLEEAGKEAPVI